MVYIYKKKKKWKEEEARKSEEPVTREKYTGGEIKMRARWRREVYDADVTVCNDALNARVYLKL